MTSLCELYVIIEDIIKIRDRLEDWLNNNATSKLRFNCYYAYLYGHRKYDEVELRVLDPELGELWLQYLNYVLHNSDRAPRPERILRKMWEMARPVEKTIVTKEKSGTEKSYSYSWIEEYEIPAQHVPVVKHDWTRYSHKRQTFIPVTTYNIPPIEGVL